MKVFNVFFILLFLVSAGLQYNDRDAVVWMGMYVYGAVLCWMALRGRHVKWMYVAGMMVYGVYAVVLLFDTDGVISWIREHRAESIVQGMKAEKPWIEATREFFGLVLLMVSVVVNWIFRIAEEGRE